MHLTTGRAFAGLLLVAAAALGGACDSGSSAPSTQDGSAKCIGLSEDACEATEGCSAIRDTTEGMGNRFLDCWARPTGIECQPAITCAAPRSGGPCVHFGSTCQ